LEVLSHQEALQAIEAQPPVKCPSSLLLPATKPVIHVDIASLHIVTKHAEHCHNSSWCCVITGRAPDCDSLVYQIWRVKITLTPNIMTAHSVLAEGVLFIPQYINNHFPAKIACYVSQIPGGVRLQVIRKKSRPFNFTSAITGIVGPNGSGKSNLSESFRFVLGEQSIKSLRGKRGEDMIWNGGGDSSAAGGGVGASRANRASVKLTFDNTSKMFPSIDFDEVTLERVVHRDNSNEYLLNGTQVRLRDIVETLGTAHIGASGHHIISQGEADRILSASIRERREMIEDALGLKVYQWKKLESIRKLEKTDENMKQVESLRREVAPHLRFLKKQVEKVEKAEEMRKDLIAIYKEYFANEESYLKSEKERLAGEIAGPKKELAELDRNLERAKEILTASKNKDKKSDEVIALEGKLASIRVEKDSITRELGRLEGEIGANKRAVEKEVGRMKQEELKTVYLKDVEELVGTIEGFKSVEDAKRLFSEVIQAIEKLYCQASFFYRFRIHSRSGEGDSGSFQTARRI
jgi:energy-coupling factor transporter ATP-binding protein EcfA2